MYQAWSDELTEAYRDVSEGKERRAPAEFDVETDFQSFPSEWIHTIQVIDYLPPPRTTQAVVEAIWDRVEQATHEGCSEFNGRPAELARISRSIDGLLNSSWQVINLRTITEQNGLLSGLALELAQLLETVAQHLEQNRCVDCAQAIHNAVANEPSLSYVRLDPKVNVALSTLELLVTELIGDAHETDDEQMLSEIEQWDDSADDDRQ